MKDHYDPEAWKHWPSAELVPAASIDPLIDAMKACVKEAVGRWQEHLEIRPILTGLELNVYFIPKTSFGVGLLRKLGFSPHEAAIKSLDLTGLGTITA